MCVKQYHIAEPSLTFDILKMLTKSLVLSRIDYALPVWGPPLNKSQVAHLQRLQNRAICVTRCLRKYDHASSHRLQLNWLPIPDQTKLKSSCVMYCYYHYNSKSCLTFDPPIQFSPQHDYHTCCKGSFANLPACRLSATKKYFRSSASWWNSLTATVPVNCSYNSFVSSAKDFYMTSL